MCFEHERIHIETSSVLMRELPVSLLRRPPQWPAYHPSVADAERVPPANDMNPTPLDVKARILSLAIDEADDTASLDVAYGMARQCGLKQPAAREIVGEVQAVVAQWRTVAAAHGLNARDVARMASAFECDEEAL